MIKAAVENGARKIILGLGGSAKPTTAEPAWQLLSVRFSVIRTKEFVPTGGTLGKIAEIDISKLKNGLEKQNSLHAVTLQIR